MRLLKYTCYFLSGILALRSTQKKDDGNTLKLTIRRRKLNALEETQDIENNARQQSKVGQII